MKFFCFCGDKLLLNNGKLPEEQILLETIDKWKVGGKLLFKLPVTSDYGKAIAYELSGPLESIQLQSGLAFKPLRETWNDLTMEDYTLAGKCRELLWWRSHNRYCGVCGHEMELTGEICLRCPECGNEVFPNVSPAIIVLVKKGDDEVLMVHARNFKGNFYGLVAGFVETGENLEQCVEREVKEETGLRIKNIRYIGSQPWPYPVQLMVGFVADYAAGEIKLQDEELSAGQFWTRDNLPPLPGKPSIARRMIEMWINREI